MKYYLLSIFFLAALNINAQIEAVEVAKGTDNMQVTDIVVVFKMHVDIGYTDWAEGVLQKYTDNMLDETLKSIEVTSSLPKAEQFIWTIPGWPLKYMLENSSEDKKIKLENAIASGRIIPHALPITFETEASDIENLVRGMGITSNINSSFDLPDARDAKLTDVPSHSRILPTLLKNAGVDILHLGCNPGSVSPDVPPLFWWQGPDGEKLLTFYWAEYYGSGILPPQDWPHKTWLAMIHTHENSGAPTPKDVSELLEEAKKKMPNVNIKIGRLSDFYDLLIKENPELPVVTGDMPDTWIHGYMSMPRETKISKELQRKTYNAEILNTQMNQWGMITSSIEPYIKEVVENMILYDEHTFGAAMSHANQQKWTYNDDFKINKSLGNYDYIEGSWIEKGNRIRKAEKIVKPLLRHNLKQLAASVNTDGKRIVVYNSLPWIRSGRVSFFAGVYQKNFKIHAVKDAVTGKITPVYEDFNLILFDADSVPSMGYKTYLPVLKPTETTNSIFLDEHKNILENKYFRLEIDENKGTLLSLTDKLNNREIIEKDSNFGFGEYFLERPGQDVIDEYNKNYIKPGAENWARDEMIRPDIPHRESVVYKGVCERITYQNMGNAVRANVWGKLNDDDLQSYLVSYTLYEDQPYVEVNWGVDGKKPNSLPEAGWFSFPFKVEKPQYRLYRTGGIVDPQTEFVNRTNYDYFFLNTSMAIFNDEGNGVVLNCPASPGVSIDNPGLFQFSREKDFTSGNVFVNLFNNQWGTNFTEWIEGSFSSKMYIWNFNNYDAEKSFITPSEETRVPLEGVFYEGKPGEYPLSQKGLNISSKGVLITAFHENKDVTLLRLWEQAGKAGVCDVKLSKLNNFKRAYPCDLRNKITDSNGIEIINDSFSFKINANQPASFILK